MTFAAQTNYAGAVLGDFANPDGMTTKGIFRKPSGSIVTLPALDGGTNVFAASFNNSDLVVGVSSATSGGVRPTYWTNAGSPAALPVLSDQYASNATYTLVGVNDSGQIAGFRTYTIPPVDETQTIAVSGSPTGGFFYIQVNYNGPQSSANLPYNATAAEVQAALNAMGEIANSASCSGGPLPSKPIVVTFGGIYSGVSLAPMTPVTQFTGGSSPQMTITVTNQARASQIVNEPLFWSSVSSAPSAIQVSGLVPTSFANNQWIAGSTSVHDSNNQTTTLTFQRLSGPSGPPTTLASFTVSDLSVSRVGHAYVNASGATVYPNSAGGVMLYQGGSSQQISASAFAYGITSDGAVYGYAGPIGAQRAFVYTKGKGMVDLNSLLPPGSQWVLESARSISDSGYVVGNAKNGNLDVQYVAKLPTGYY